MALYLFRKTYMIEFKTEQGKQFPAQREWEGLIKAHGFNYVVVRSLEQFQQFICETLLTANRSGI